MDWRPFGFEYRIRLKTLSSDLIRIEAYKEAATNLVLPSDWRSELDRLNRVRAVHGTTAIEGNPLSEAKVQRQMELLAAPSEPLPDPSREQRQVRNASLAQDWVKKRFAPQTPPIRVSDILRMHELLTQGSDETNNVPGQLRTHSVIVGTKELGGVHRGAPPRDLPKLVQGFVDFINSRKLAEEHPVVRALLAHFFLITIHPFGDGNGRVSRLVEAGILFQGDYSVLGFYGLSNYFYRNGDEYKRLLQWSRRLRPFDLSEFTAFGLKGFAAELEGINTFIKTKLNRVIYRDMLLRAQSRRVGKRRRALNRREYDLLVFLLDKTEPVDPFAAEPSRKIELFDLVRDPYIEAVYRGVTRRTFLRELTRLAETGFLRFDARAERPTVELDFGAIGKY